MIVLSKYTVVYSKENEGIYISHLDFLRTIGRSLRRAGLPVKYSEGFNPHACISFASPLGVGVSSVCERFSVQLTEEVPPEEIEEKLSLALPSCIKVIRVSEGEEDFSKISYADYEIVFEGDITQAQLRKFLEMQEILMPKKTKKGIKEVNIREDIFDITGNNKVYKATLKTGNEGNLKPMLLTDALTKYVSPEIGFCTYKRLCFKDKEQNIL